MASNPGGISKGDRQNALRQVLERWGRLDKPKINQHVAAKLGCEAESLGRALYRDLQEMVASGEVIQYHFSRDGTEIEDYAPELHRNVQSEWAAASAESTIVGSKALTEVGASFIAQPRLTRAFRIESSDATDDGRFLTFYFALSTRSFALKLELESLPATLIVARPTEEPPAHPLQVLEPAFGKRSALLLVPISSVTSFRDATRPGHVAIHVITAEQIEIADLGSKNGTFIRALEAEEAQARIRRQKLMESATLSSTLGMKSGALSGLTRLADPGFHALKLPGLIQISMNFAIIIAAPAAKA